MKLLIISDCHANIDALLAVWAKESDSDYILFAGDMVDFGFYPRETVQWFMEHRERLFAVRGNHDEGILARQDESVTDELSDFQTLTLSRLTDAEYAFLHAIPHEITFTVGDTDFYMCHTVDELSDDIFYPENQIPSCNTKAFLEERFAAKFPTASAPRRMAIYGHSHLQWAASAGENQMILNPGSLSYRFGSLEPVRCADYMVLEDGNIGMRHVSFDTAHLYDQATSLANPDHVNLAHAFYRP